MRRLLGAIMLLLASSAIPAMAELGESDDTPMLMNAQMAQEMKSRAARLGTSSHASDTTWVGYNPAYAGSNYWSIGVGHRRPRGTFGPNKSDIPPVPDDDTGYWDWDHPVHGDSLQGWWPMRHNYRSFAISNLPDDQRPWHAIDIGNSMSYVINQGPGDPIQAPLGLRRTFGITSAWHEDAGVTAKVPDPNPEKSDVNPNPPRWAPIAGSMSAWCGLRAHGDVTQVDALTGNPYTEDAIGGETQQANGMIPGGPGWTNYRFPGYGDQWDQMLFKDIDIGSTDDYPPELPVLVSFKYRTRMSTGKGVNPTSRTGWFDKDPLAVVAGNFISSSAAGDGAPIDSFMVYVGCPVADTVGAEWTGSDGLTHQVFDPVRRWFGELVRANEANGHYELFTTYGNDPPLSAPADSNAFKSVTVMRPDVTYGTLRSAWGDRMRLVFRIKTNRGREAPSSDDSGSLPGSYNSGYLGAAQLDDVSIIGSGTTSLGGFDAKGDIDNSTDNDQVGQLGYVNDNWHTSSKPPAIYHHVHALSDLLYQDLCGPPGSVSRICDLAGNVISMGDHDLGEAFNGPLGTAEQEHFQGITSPTINLAFDPGNPTAKNNMGLDADTAVPTGEWLVAYNIYTGGMDVSNLGSTWQVYAMYYPATQTDGTRTWTTMRAPQVSNYNPDKQCWDASWFLGLSVRTTNPNGQPDSIRIGFRKLTTCYSFGITTNCGTTLGGYLDNVSLGLVDGAEPAGMSVSYLWNDTFPANESPGLPGTAGFDTTAALIKSSSNTAPLTGDLTRYVVPADSLLVGAPGDSTEVQLKFRIWPGPGNYVIPGDPCSGLRRVPSDTTRITPGDGSFWTEYILNTGKDEDEMPTHGPCKGGGPLRHDQRWSEMVWCSARLDTAEANLFPIAARSISTPVLVGRYATIYHEDDEHLAVLGIPRHKCFLIDTAGAVNMTNISCEDPIPLWVTDGGPPYRTGYDGNATQVEGTKILPDGLLTPGSHVQYFFLKKNLGTSVTSMLPDTSMVFPQLAEGNFDGHRWQQFSVLPDAWKFSAYGGLGKACMLYVDWADRRGTERVWVSVADSIGATNAARRGAHNGWTAPSKLDINDPAYFVNKNAQPGTTWDMYGIKAIESLGSQSGRLGARLAYRGPGTLLTDKWAKIAPTPEMLEAYYRVLMILTGDLSSGVFGPFIDMSADDTEIIRQFVISGTASAHKGLWVQGSGAAADMYDSGNTTLAGILSVSLRNDSYLAFSGNSRVCIDLIPQSMITANGDIYGIRNSCLQTLAVLQSEGDGVPASYYDPVGANPLNAPYVASVFTDAEPAGNPENHWQALIDGFDTSELRSRLCDKTYGRLAYFWNVFNNVFGKICSVAGTGPLTTEVPNNAEGRTFVEFAGQNPLRQGNAVINFTLAKGDRVTAKVYDVSGRLVRTLADGQFFKADSYSLQWDGLDNGSRQVSRGAYFVHVKLHDSRIDQSRKMILLK